MKRTFHAVLLLSLSALVGSPWLPAVTYPARTGENNVVDLADVIEPGDEAAIMGRIQEVLRSTGVPIVVLAIPSLSNYTGGENWTIERYAAGLYNEWGIGTPPASKGILLLVSVGDRKLRIASGSGYGNEWEAPARRIIDDVIVPRFRRGDMSEGIRAGVEAIASELTRQGGGGVAEPLRPATRSASTPADTRSMPTPVEIPPSTGEGGGWQPRGTGVGLPKKGRWGIGTLIFIGFVIMAILAVVSVVRGLFRRVTGGLLGGGGGRGRVPVSRSPGGMGGWGGLLTGGLLGYFGSKMVDGFSRRRSGGGLFGGSGGSGSSWGGSGGGGFSSGGGSSFGGGHSSGGGATGSW